MPTRTPVPHRAATTVPAVAVAVAVVVTLAAGTARAADVTRRVSVGPGGVQGDEGSFGPSISADGRLVVFQSAAATLVPGDAGGTLDVIVHDRRTGENRSASVGPGGVRADGFVQTPSISGDGRVVAFASDAANLVPGGDANPDFDVFVRDLAAGVTRLASVGPGGVQGNRYSSSTTLSADGRVVAFRSAATNLVAGDTNDHTDVFVRDLDRGVTRRASVGPGGVQADEGSGAPSISADGRLVAFVSDATNLVPRDTNGTADVFVRDLEAGTTRRVSVGSGGAQGDGQSRAPAISADGRRVAFWSAATNLVAGDTNGARDVFVHDLGTGRTRRASLGRGGAQADGDSVAPAISADGRVVAFLSEAANLVPRDTNGDRDVFVRDLAAGETVRASVGSGGAQADDDSHAAALSADGRAVAFDSDATNLVRGDTNGERDVFVRVR